MTTDVSRRLNAPGAVGVCLARALSGFSFRRSRSHLAEMSRVIACDLASQKRKQLIEGAEAHNIRGARAVVIFQESGTAVVAEPH